MLILGVCFAYPNFSGLFLAAEIRRWIRLSAPALGLVIGCYILHGSEDLNGLVSGQMAGRCANFLPSDAGVINGAQCSSAAWRTVKPCSRQQSVKSEGDADKLSPLCNIEMWRRDVFFQRGRRRLIHTESCSFISSIGQPRRRTVP